MTLLQARKRKGLTQIELAAMAGITPVALSLIENYKVVPRAETRKKLQEIFDDEIEFYPTSLLVEMISRCVGTDSTASPHRAEFLKSEIDKIVRNFKPIKS